MTNEGPADRGAEEEEGEVEGGESGRDRATQRKTFDELTAA